MSGSEEMTLSQFHKYWDGLVAKVKDQESRIARLEAGDNAGPEKEKKKKSESKEVEV